MAEKKHKVSRDAGKGRFVTGDFAKENPATTVTEVVATGKAEKKAKKPTKDAAPASAISRPNAQGHIVSKDTD